MTTPISRNSAVLFACLLAFAVAAFASCAAAAGIHFQKESLHAYERQLAKGEVHADAFHPGIPTGHLHISLNDGRHMTVAYGAGEQAKLVAQAHAKGARVQVAAAKAKTAAVKHKLRYIAGAILIVVILIVLGVLLIGRRRTLAQEGQRPGESATP